MIVSWKESRLDAIDRWKLTYRFTTAFPILFPQDIEGYLERDSWMFGSAGASPTTFIRSDPEILFGFFSVVGHELTTYDYRMRLYDFFGGEEVAWGEDFWNQDVIPFLTRFFKAHINFITVKAVK